MKKIIITVLVLFALSGCASEQSKYLSKVLPDATNANRHYMPVQYITYPDCINDLKEKAKLEMWDSVKLKNGLAHTDSLYKNGYLKIHTIGSSIEEANPKEWIYIIQDNTGKEILRQNGKDKTPKYSVVKKSTTSRNGSYSTTYSRTYTTWHAIDILIIPDKISEPFKFYLINTIGKTRNSFTIYADKNMAPK